MFSSCLGCANKRPPQKPQASIVIERELTDVVVTEKVLPPPPAAAADPVVDLPLLSLDTTSSSPLPSSLLPIGMTPRVLPSNVGEPGTFIKHYEIKSLLGEGAQGKVILAHDIKLDRDCAIKIVTKSRKFKRGKEGKYGRASGQLAREIAIMKRLVHPNIVTLFEVLDDPNEDKLFLVMELVSGGPVLRDDLEQVEPLPEPVAKSYFRQLVCGLEYLHFHGIIHKDIKPANLLVASNGVVKFSDFGVSVLCHPFKSKSAVPATTTTEGERELLPNLQEEEPQQVVISPPIPAPAPPSPPPQFGLSFDATIMQELTTKSFAPSLQRNIAETPLPLVTPRRLLNQPKTDQKVGEDDLFTGTLAFYPPEALRHESYLGKVADVWALGITLFIFLYGRLPFDRLDDAEEMAHQVNTKEIEFDNPLVSPQAINLLRHMLHKDVNVRMTDLQEIKLHEWFLGEEVLELTVMETTAITVSETEVETAVTEFDLSQPVQLLVRSKSWTNNNAPPHPVVEQHHLQEEITRRKSMKEKDDDDALWPGLKLDVQPLRSRNFVPGPLTMPAERDLRNGGTLANEFKNKTQEPLHSKTDFLLFMEEYKVKHQERLLQGKNSSESRKSHEV